MFIINTMAHNLEVCKRNFASSGTVWRLFPIFLFRKKHFCISKYLLIVAYLRYIFLEMSKMTSPGAVPRHHYFKSDMIILIMAQLLPPSRNNSNIKPQNASVNRDITIFSIADKSIGITLPAGAGYRSHYNYSDHKRCLWTAEIYGGMEWRYEYGKNYKNG